MTRALSPAEQAIAGYQWLTTTRIATEMQSSRQKVINLIKSGAFGKGNVTRWGRDYRVRPEAFRAYLQKRAEEVDDAAA